MPKVKKDKDPNQPKRNLSAYFLFSGENRAAIKAANPEYGIGDVAKKLGKMWAEIDEKTKGKYQAMAEKDKARYEKVTKSQNYLIVVI